jgi:thiamine biosynthesis lipoprotein
MKIALNLFRRKLLVPSIGMALCSVILFSGCGEPEWKHYSAVAMDTEIQANLLCEEASRCDSAFVLLMKEAAEWEARMGSHVPGLGFASWSMKLGDTLQPDSDQELLLSQAYTLMEASNGRFDPGLFSLKQAWGLSSGDSPRIPDSLFLDSLSQTFAANTEGKFDPARAPYRSLNPSEKNSGPWVWQRAQSRLDLGGLAKGAAVDRWHALLDSLGVPVHMLQAGGDLRVGAAKPIGDWRIGIRNPRRPDTLCGVLALKPGEAVSTSGDYERFFDSAGVRYHHIFDPLTARPAQGIVAVTVIAPEAVWADGLSTALFVLGPDAGAPLAKRYGAIASWFRMEGGELCRNAMTEFGERVQGDWPPPCARGFKVHAKEIEVGVEGD